MKLFSSIIPLTAVLALAAGSVAFAEHSNMTNPHGSVVGRPATHVDVDSNPHRNPHGKLVGRHNRKFPKHHRHIVSGSPRR